MASAADHKVYVIYKDGKPWKGHEGQKKRRAAYEKKGAAKSAITEDVNSEVYKQTRAAGFKYMDPGYNTYAEVVEASERSRYLILEYGAQGVVE